MVKRGSRCKTRGHRGTHIVCTTTFLFLLWRHLLGLNTKLNSPAVWASSREPRTDKSKRDWSIVRAKRSYQSCTPKEESYSNSSRSSFTVVMASTNRSCKPAQCVPPQASCNLQKINKSLTKATTVVTIIALICVWPHRYMAAPL